jgi:transposase InsO family protein
VLRVNRSTYYKHFNSPEAPRNIENQRIRRAILELYTKSKQRFGAGKIRQRLSAEYGINISEGRVYRLMKGMSLPKMSTVKPKPAPKTMSADSECPNLLNKQFNPSAPNRVWVSDITYIKVNGKFVYLCVIIDLFARKLIAYKIGARADASLTIDTFNTAYKLRGAPAGTLFHSDRGVQYTAKDFRKLLDNANFIQSFSAKGHPYDNAVVESFFKFLKHEEIDRRSFDSLDELNLALFEYMHFYNHSRPHSANDNLTPHELESRFFNDVLG